MTQPDMLDLLERITLHHKTTSMPLAIENYGSQNAMAVAGRQLWGTDIPAPIADLHRLNDNPLEAIGQERKKPDHSWRTFPAR